MEAAVKSFLILLLFLTPMIVFAEDRKKPEYCDWDGKIKSEYYLDNVVTGAAVGLITTFVVSIVRPTVLVGSFAGFSVVVGITGMSMARASDCSDWYESSSHSQPKKGKS